MLKSTFKACIPNLQAPHRSNLQTIGVFCHFFTTQVFYFSLNPSHSKNNMRQYFPKVTETVLKGICGKFTGLELTGNIKRNTKFLQVVKEMKINRKNSKPLIPLFSACAIEANTINPLSFSLDHQHCPEDLLVLIFAMICTGLCENNLFASCSNTPRDDKTSEGLTCCRLWIHQKNITCHSMTPVYHMQ